MLVRMNLKKIHRLMIKHNITCSFRKVNPYRVDSKKIAGKPCGSEYTELAKLISENCFLRTPKFCVKIFLIDKNEEKEKVLKEVFIIKSVKRIIKGICKQSEVYYHY